MCFQKLPCFFWEVRVEPILDLDRADAKMVLLFLALQRDLGIQFDPMSTARAETLSDVGDLVWEQLRNGEEKRIGS